MPEPLDENGRLITQLRNDLADIHYRWKSVLELYKGDAEQLRLAQTYGNDFFAVIQEAQADDLILALARFTDVDKDGEFQTVNLAKAIQRFLPKGCFGTAKARLGLVWSKIKNRRDKILAHRDYGLLVAKTAQPLEGITYKEVRGFIDEVTAIMREIDKAFEDTYIAYDDPIRHGSWKIIFEALADAEHLTRLQQRAESGLQIHPDDLFRKPKGKR
jgi:hypothetical protein